MPKHRAPAWNRLDNAAKIFPPASGKRDTKVFRFSCELTEPVRESILQRALDQALEDFPFYRSILKQGFFWHYFERSNLKPVVMPENTPPCAPLYHINSRNLLFQVSYFYRRINLEIYHALTDGTGALQFLRTIVFYYLMELHGNELDSPISALDYDASVVQKEEDSFQKYYEQLKPVKEPKSPAYQLKGPELPEGRLRVIGGICPAKEVLKAAHSYHTTLTVYLTAVLLCAISERMSLHDRRKPVTVCVPVNLRNYYDSETARNFFSVMNVSYQFGKEPPNLEDVILKVQEAFERELTKEKIGSHVAKLISIEKNPFIRVTPLFIKRFALKIAHDSNRKEATASLSNIGRITMPEPLCKYIERFDVFVSTTRVQACICSFNNKLSITFTSSFASTEVTKNFFRTLTGAGIPVEIVSNLIHQDELIERETSPRKEKGRKINTNR